MKKAQGLKVLLDPGEQVQLTSICTIRMVQAEELVRRFVLDGIKREVTAILQQHALAVQETVLPYPGKRLSAVHLDQLDLQGTLADQYPPGSSQAREKCEGTCSGKCTLAHEEPPAFWTDKRVAEDLDGQGLRGGEADEESLQGRQGTIGTNI